MYLLGIYKYLRQKNSLEIIFHILLINALLTIEQYLSQIDKIEGT